jgi:cell migration-inducing and hyaluronan-binding protein
MKVSGVELRRMGQHETLARYPIHWHLVGDGGKGQYIENSAIHDTYSRCVTVHGTNDLRIQNNVAYNNVGHCYFLEDGAEHGNQYLNNLGILTRCNTTRACNPTNAVVGTYAGGRGGQQARDQLIPSDNTAATFWITNPDNTYIGNVSAGSEATGFWIALSAHPTGKFAETYPELTAKIWPRRTQIREMSGNVAHSNIEGLMFDRGPSNTGTFNLAGNTHMAYTDTQTRQGPLESVIKDFTIYKSRGAAIWARGQNHVFDGLKIADSAIGYTHAYPGGEPSQAASFTSKVINSLFVGESDNKGTPKTEAEIKYGRSLPRADADYPVRGYEYYDFIHQVENTKFVNYQDNETRKSGALSYLLFSSFPVSSDNSVEKITLENAKPVYFPPRDCRWSFSGECGSLSGYNRAGIHDKDGSLTGVPDAYVLNNNTGTSYTQINDKDCKLEPTWGAAVCKAEWTRAAGYAGRGNGGRGGGAGAAGGRGGAPGAGAGAGPRGGGAPGAAPGGRGGAPGGGFGGGAPGGAPGGGRGGARGGAPGGGFGGGAPGAAPGGNN